MFSFFKSNPKVKITSQDRSILDLKLQRDKLKQYQKRIEKVLDREKEIAREALAKGNRARALTALRQRKYQESLLSQTDSQLETLQKLVSTIEFALVEKDILFGLQQGSAVLKEINREINLDMVEQLMSDTAEGVAYQKEVNDMLCSKMSAADEEDVLAELAALEADAVVLPSVPVSQLPVIPISERAPVQAEEEEEVQPARERQRIAA